MGWRHEPLVHFALLGAALFALNAIAGGQTRPDTIVVDPDRLIAQHTLRAGAPPSTDEHADLIADYVRSEALYREARTLGLDTADTIIRRRLIQKMELVLERTGGGAEPTNEDLAEILAADPDRFSAPPRWTLVHAYLRDGPELEVEAGALRAGLVAGTKTVDDGDPFIRGHELKAHTEAQLAAKLGDDFAASVTGLDIDAWSEPIRSPYGLHVVRVVERHEGGAPSVDDARAALREAWIEHERAARRSEAERAIIAKYEVQLP